MQTSDAFTPRSTTTVAGIYAPCNTSGSQGENPSPLLCEIEGNVARAQREEGQLGSQHDGQDLSLSITRTAPQTLLAGGSGLPGKAHIASAPPQAWQCNALRDER